ncbi:hypothetical protein [Bacteroides heparinolyticus]|uniref:hypothetical protein n=1 Tax=Prevotella heparinolytica TaxID=28113 RepID=UPI0023F49CC5|nr:hypothetical protein [Bacteroides heparinolyticus]
MNIITKIINVINQFIYNNHVNWIKTIYFNFKSLPASVAIKLPIFIYGGTDLVSLNGNIQITGSIKRGIIKIGKKWDRSEGRTKIRNLGTIVFGNNDLICQGSKIVVNHGAYLIFEDSVNIRENVDIIAWNKITIGENTGIANRSQLMDTDFHYMINILDRSIKNNISEITIGKNNWIGSYTTIKKGTKTPNNTIVSSSYAVLCKDYTKIIPENSIIGGIPAKLIATNYRRVFNMENQSMLLRYFECNTNPYIVNPTQELDEFCDY